MMTNRLRKKNGSMNSPARIGPFARLSRRLLSGKNCNRKPGRLMMHLRRALVCLVFAACMGHASLGHGAMTTEQRLRALEEQLRKAQSEIERLRGEVQQQKAVSQGAQTQIEEARKQTEDQDKKIDKGIALPDWAK